MEALTADLQYATGALQVQDPFIVPSLKDFFLYHESLP